MRHYAAAVEMMALSQFMLEGPSREVDALMEHAVGCFIEPASVVGCAHARHRAPPPTPPPPPPPPVRPILERNVLTCARACPPQRGRCPGVPELPVR